MTTRKTVVALATAALVAIPTAAAAAPAGPGSHHGNGRAASCQRASGDCAGGRIVVGSLTKRQIATLKSMAEEEKLAHDVYQALNEKFGGVVFERIATSEAQHLAALRRLMDRYDVDDPTRGLPAGQFVAVSATRLYTDLVSRAANPEQAMAVGATVERMDIDDLEDAIDGAGRRDLKRMYANLLRGSQRHLVAFSR